MRRRRSLCALGSVVAVTICGLSGVGPASAAVVCPEVDLAIGAPHEDVGTDGTDAGAVTLAFVRKVDTGVQHATGDGGYLLITAADVGGTPHAGDLFGSSAAVGRDPSGDCSLVAVGAPGANGGEGAVYLFKVLSSTSLTPIAVLSQGSAGLADVAEAGDHFGASVAFNALYAGRWLAVGAPGEDVGTAADAGVVDVLPLDGLGAGDVPLQQGTGTVPGSAEAGDAFGSALSFDGEGGDSLAVGAPGEDLGAAVDAGGVTLLPGTPTDLPGTLAGAGLTQSSAGVPGSSESGDRFGASLAAAWCPLSASDFELAVGAPGEAIGSLKAAGAVTVVYGPGSYALLTQGSVGESGTPEAGDAFGASLSGGGETLAVGAPGEDVGSLKDAGLADVYFFAPTVGEGPEHVASKRTTTWQQNTAGVAGSAEAGDRFGASVAFTKTGVIFGVPGEDGSKADEGALTAIPLGPGGTSLTTTGQQALTQSSAGFPGSSEAGDGLGWSLSIHR